MRLTINISKTHARILASLLVILVLGIAADYASSSGSGLLQWHPLSEISADGGATSIATTAGRLNSSVLDGPINVSSNGNVGIGTPSPGAKLHVSAGDSSLALFGPNAIWGGKLYVGAAPNQAAAATAQVISTDGNLHLDPAPSKNMYLGYYQARDIYINPNGGNVGIGTAGPGQKLDVNGNIAANNGNALLFYQGGEGEVLRLTGNNGQNVHLENINGVFRLVNSPWTADIFHVDQSGNAYIPGQVTIAGGSPGTGKVLTSDANGVASWQAVSSGVSQQTIPAPIFNEWTNEPYLKDGNPATYADVQIPMTGTSRVITYDLGAVKGLVVVKYDGEVYASNGFGDWSVNGNLHLEYSEDGSNWQAGLKSISTSCRGSCDSGRQSITESVFIARYIRFVGYESSSYYGATGWARIYEAKVYY